jgi:hypothetical protein
VKDAMLELFPPSLSWLIEKLPTTIGPGTSAAEITLQVPHGKANRLMPPRPSQGERQRMDKEPCRVARGAGGAIRHAAILKPRLGVPSGPPRRARVPDPGTGDA